VSVDRSSPPRAHAVGTVTFPAFLRHRLSSGVDILVARTPKVPLATLEIILPGGAEREPRELHGLATLTAGMLDEGTSRHDVHAIASRVERTGSYLTTSADWDATYLQCGGLAANWEENLATLCESVFDPAFPLSEFERLRQQRQAELLARRDQPSALADEAFAALLYAGTPYDHVLGGDDASLARTGRDDAAGFHRRHLSARGAALVAAGDLDPAAVLRIAERAFADLPALSIPPAAEVRPLSHRGVRVRIVDRPGAAQTELRVGHLGVGRSNPDRATLRILNSLLGGKFTSRINLNLRERHGYTYGAFSRFADRRGPGPFTVSCAAGTEHVGAATREILAELARLRDERVTPEELADTRSYLLGVYPYSLQTADDLVDRLETLAVHDLPDDYHSRQLEALRTVTADDILAAAGRYLHPDDAVVVAVGPRADLLPQLAPLGLLLD